MIRHLQAPGYRRRESLCHRSRVHITSDPAKATCGACLRLLERLQQPSPFTTGEPS